MPWPEKAKRKRPSPGTCPFNRASRLMMFSRVGCRSRGSSVVSVTTCDSGKPAYLTSASLSARASFAPLRSVMFSSSYLLTPTSRAQRLSLLGSLLTARSPAPRPSPCRLRADAGARTPPPAAASDSRRTKHSLSFASRLISDLDARRVSRSLLHPALLQLGDLVPVRLRLRRLADLGVCVCPAPVRPYELGVEAYRLR